MDEREWLTSTDPQAMLTFLRENGNLPERKARLFSAAVCRRIWHLLTDERSRNAIEVAERFADGVADEEELRLAVLNWKFPDSSPDAVAYLTAKHRYDRPSILFRYGIVDLAQRDEEANRRLEHICSSGLRFPPDVALAVDRRVAAFVRPVEAHIQAVLLRDIVGFLPFRPPPTLDPSVLRWNNGTVQRLAEDAYEHRVMPAGTLDPHRLAVLADALLDAGCTDSEILGHLRDPGPHWRGCYILDILLGKS